MNRLLWIIQGLLARLFLFTGVMKLITPVEEMTKEMTVPMSGAFLHFIAVAEILGALGLILPGLLRIRPGLTPLAVCGLTIIVIGATAVRLAGSVISMALLPLATALLAGFVAYGRWRLAPLPSRKIGVGLGFDLLGSSRILLAVFAAHNMIGPNGQEGTRPP